MQLNNNVELIPLSSNDSDLIFQLYNDPSLDLAFTDYMFPRYDTQAKASLDRWLSSNEQRHFIVTYDSEKVGLAGIFNIHLVNRKCNVGIILKNNYQHKGIGTATLNGLIKICFAKLNLRKIEVEILDGNSPSVRLFESVGFVREGTLIQSILHNGEYIDIHYYGLTNNKF